MESHAGLLLGAVDFWDVIFPLKTDFLMHPNRVVFIAVRFSNSF